MDKSVTGPADVVQASPGNLSLLSMDHHPGSLSKNLVSIVDKPTLANLPSLNLTDRGSLPAYSSVLNDPLARHATGTIIASYTAGYVASTWANRTVEVSNRSRTTTLNLLDGVEHGIAGLGASVADIAGDAYLQERFPSQAALFRPNIPESVAMSAAVNAPLRFRAAAIGTAWLMGRVYDYAWEKFDNSRSEK